MDLTPTPANTTSNNTASTKSPEPEPDTPTRIQPGKPFFPFTNGVLKRHQAHPPPPPPPPNPNPPVTYRECLKNYAASIGGHALDGCGEFMPSPAATDSDPTSIRCAACGCHRNFHRRDPDDSAAAPHTQIIEYQPHHRHQPPPPPPPPRSPGSASPPPISSSYYAGHHPYPRQQHHHHSAAPHVLLALSTAGRDNSHHPAPPSSAAALISPISRKRFRTKFTQAQKDRMFEFAERVGWKIQRRDDNIIREFCHEIGVERGVLKVWMHNNKNTLGGKQPRPPPSDEININGVDNGTENNNYDVVPTTTSQLLMKSETNGVSHHHHHHHLHLGTSNGSSSSS